MLEIEQKLIQLQIIEDQLKETLLIEKTTQEELRAQMIDVIRIEMLTEQILELKIEEIVQ